MNDSENRLPSMKHTRCFIAILYVAVYISFVTVYFMDKINMKDDLDFKDIAVHIYVSTALIIVNLLICVGLTTESILRLVCSDSKDCCLYLVRFIMLCSCFISSLIFTMSYIIILNCYMIDNKIAELCIFDPHMIYRSWFTMTVLITLLIHIVILPYISSGIKRCK